MWWIAQENGQGEEPSPKKAEKIETSRVSGTSRIGDVADKSPGRDTTATAELLSEPTSLQHAAQNEGAAGQGAQAQNENKRWRS